MPRRVLLVSIALIAFAIAPIWAVDHFVNQDGPARAYSAHVATELLRGNPVYSEIYALNPAPVPNSTGHWLLMLLLLIFDKFVATKLMATLTFVAPVAAVLWLRWRANGDGLFFVLFFGVTISFNWLWLQAFYNFFIGLAGFAFAIGLFAKWRGGMNPSRASALGLALIFVYFSHLLCFAATAGSLIVLAVFGEREARKKDIAFVSLALIPAAALCVAYLLLSGGGGGFAPQWDRLADPFSLGAWFEQMRTADPFLILSRRFAPFVEEPSSLFLALAPVIWIFLAVGILVFIAFRSGVDFWELLRSRHLGYLVVFLIFVIGATVSPDTLGDAQGSIIRPRMVLFAAIAVVPLLPVAARGASAAIASCCLAVAILIQTASLWDYSLRTEAEMRPIIAAGGQLNDFDTIVGVASVPSPVRYAAEPKVHAADMLAVGRDIVVWNSFEFGYRLFPVVTRNELDRQFVAELTKATAIVRGSSGEAQQLESLRNLIERESGRIDAIILVSDDERIARVIEARYQAASESGKAKVFRRRSIE